MGTSESRLCEENCGFLPQSHRSNSQVAEKITGARLSDVRTTEADHKTKEAGELMARAQAVVERIEEASPCCVAMAFAGKKEEINKPTLNLKTILKKADSPVDWSSEQKLLAQLEAGVLLSKNRKKFYVKSSKNCYMLFAGDLAIAQAEDNKNKYWKWQPPEDKNSDMSVSVAEMLNVCWLEVHGQLNSKKLSPETLYEVVFEIMLKETAYGWEVPVNIRLTLPDGNQNEHKENLMAKPRRAWIEIPAGEFKTPLAKDGKIEFSMYEYEGGDWKRGLVIRGAIIRPKV